MPINVPQRTSATNIRASLRRSLALRSPVAAATLAARLTTVLLRIALPRLGCHGAPLFAATKVGCHVCDSPRRGLHFPPPRNGHIVDRRSCLCRLEWLSRRRCWIVVRSSPPAGVRVWVVRPLAGCLSGLFYSVQPIRGIDLSYIYTLNAAKRHALKHTACCSIAATDPNAR